MNDPEYLAHVADRAEELAGQLHAALTQVIVERIMIRLKRGVDYRLTASDKWMLEVLQEAGYLREDLMKELSDRTGVILKEMSDAFEDAAVEAIRWDDAVYKAAGLDPTPLRQSPHLMRLVQRGCQKTKGEWRNFTGTLADASQEKFITECDKAYHLTASHAMSYTQAIRQAVEAVAEDGVRVTYPSGHTDTIETATARAVRTGVGQACGDITLERMKEMGWDIALVSAHLGARTGDGGENFTNHYWLQGKFYSLSGRDKRFLPLSVCGIGDVRGLLGANCRHSIGPGDGEFNPFQHFDSEENRKRYELDQRQRLLERRIRATRREMMGLQAGGDLTEERYRRKAFLLQRQEAEYDAFCKENDLKKLSDRLAVARYGPEQARTAERAAKGIEKSANSGIMQDRDGYAEQEGHEPVIPEKYKDDFADFEPLTLEPEEKEALAGLRKLSDENGFEYGQAKTDEGFSEAFTSLISNGVEVPEKFLDGRSVELFHAHTNVTPLSGMDFRLLTHPGVKRMTVIASNGDVFSVRVGDGDRPTAGEFDDVMDWLRNDVDVGMVDWPEYFDWTPQELNYMSIREQAFRIARHFKWHLEGGKL